MATDTADHENYREAPAITVVTESGRVPLSQYLEDNTGGGGDPVAWDDVTDKPTTFPPVIGSGATDAVAGNDARLTAGAAGTATVRAIGSTSTTAAAGNHSHTATQVTATAISPGTATDVQGILAELAARITDLETP